MLIAHIADLHLGYRAYHRVVGGGMNAREADVALAFHEAIERLVELHPDLVLVAGDVFHTVRPSNAAIANAFRRFASLAARLPDTPVVMIAGNHDSPRSSDTGNILSLFSEIPNLFVVTEGAERVWLEAIDTSVLCLPHNALAQIQPQLAREGEPEEEHPDGAGGGAEAEPEPEDAGAGDVEDAKDAKDAAGEAPERVALEPDPEARYNVMMLHGTVSGSAAEGKIRYVSEYGGVAVPDTAIGPDRWDYVALGHYHVATELAPNMWYAGGLERTSTNIWMEEGEKGFLTYDTDTRRATFHPLPSRAVVDLPRLSAQGLSPAEVDEAIEAAVGSIPGGVDGKVVRLVITDVPRHIVRELNHTRIRELKAEALHFHIDARPPEINRVVGSGAPIRRQTLEEQVESFLEKHWTLTSEAIQRDRLVALAQRYLEEVGGDE